MRIVFALAAAALTISPVSAQSSASPADAEETAAKSEEAPAAKEDEKICRNISQMGSRKKERKCMTQKEWLRFNRGE